MTHHLDCDIWFKEGVGGHTSLNMLLQTNEETNKWSDILRWVSHQKRGVNYYTFYNLIILCIESYSGFVHTLHLLTFCICHTLHLSYSAYGQTLHWVKLFMWSNSTQSKSISNKAHFTVLHTHKATKFCEDPKSEKCHSLHRVKLCAGSHFAWGHTLPWVKHYTDAFECYCNVFYKKNYGRRNMMTSWVVPHR